MNLQATYLLFKKNGLFFLFFFGYTLVGISQNSLKLCAGSSFTVSEINTSSVPGFYVASFLKASNPFQIIPHALAMDYVSPVYENFYHHQITVMVPLDLEYGTDYLISIIGNSSNFNFTDVTIGNLNGYDYTVKNKDGYVFQNKMEICQGTIVPLEAQMYKDGQPYDFHINYAWYKDYIKISDNLNPIQVTEPGKYRVWAEQGGCSVLSPEIEVSVGSNISAATDMGSETMSICELNPVTIHAQHISNTATYQWKKDNIDLPGETERSFTPIEKGNYSLEVKDNTCMATSICPIVNLGSSLQANIYSYEITLCGGNLIWLYISENIKKLYNRADNYGVKINWQKDGNDITSDGINYYLGSNFLQNFVKLPGKYRLKLVQENCITYSNEIEIINGNQRDKPILKPGSAFPAICSTNGYLVDWGNIDKSKIFKNDVFYGYGSSLNAYNSGTYTLIVGEGTSCANESDPVVISIGTVLQANISTTKTKLCGSSDKTILKLDMSENYGTYNYQWQKDNVDIPNQTSCLYNCIW